MKKIFEKTRSIAFKNATYIVIALFALFIILKMPLFFTKTSLLNLSSQAAVFGIVTVGMMLEMITGVADISVGAGVYLSGAIGVRVFLATDSIPLALAAAIISGIAGSSLPGIAVAYFGVPDMVAGMSAMFILRGIGDMVIGADTVVNLDSPAFQWFGQGKVLGLAVPVLVLLAVFIIGIFVLHFTKFGRYVYAVGDNRDALRASGVNDKHIQYLAYAITGFLVGIAGFCNVARLGGCTFNMADGLEFNCIAACAVGGVNIAGGAGTMYGGFLGVIVIAAINQLLRLFDISALLYKLVWGLVVIISISFSVLKRYQIAYDKSRRIASKIDE